MTLKNSKTMNYKPIKVIISGGGTGGHIFPAISIAAKIRELSPDSEILFVGAKGRMEMDKVPAAGFKIKGLPVSGLQRKVCADNLLVPFKLLRSIRMARRMISDLKPDIAIGVGGYASAPLLFAAQSKGIPTLIQEQNGFAGLTNRLLGRKAKCICVAFEGMEKFFPKERIVLTGNPIRREIVDVPTLDRAEACRFYNLDPSKKIIFLMGGSLGAGTLNRAVMKWIEGGMKGGENLELLWQCGRYYKKSVDKFMEDRDLPGVHPLDFLFKMDYAYAAADLVISRAGASSVSELCVAAKPVIFVPSPNVAEDHQTHNAMALVDKGAAEIVRDDEAVEKLFALAAGLVKDERKLSEMKKNIAALALPDAAETIVKEVYKLI